MLARRRFTGLFAFAALFCAAVAGQAQAPYVDAVHKFAITPPSGWIINHPNDVLVVFIEPITGTTGTHGKETSQQFMDRINKQYGKGSGASQGFRANITIMSAAPPPGINTLADYSKQARAKAARLRMFKILSEKPQKLGGMPAIERNIQLTTPERTTVRTREIICLRNGQVFTVTFASSPAALAKFNPIFNKTLASFIWK
jgi:hypothetical protein